VNMEQMKFRHNGLAYEFEYEYSENDGSESISLISISLNGRDVTAEIDKPTQCRMLNAALAVERRPHPQLLQLRRDLQLRRRLRAAESRP
jgi:hypothetical protein